MRGIRRYIAPLLWQRAASSSLRYQSTANEGHPPPSNNTCGSGSAESGTSKPAPKKIQIAVVGSGPSGCFVASYLTKKNAKVHVDILERLPVPFGLCRYGVAPDHPDVKNVEKSFLELFKSGRVTWIGNVTVGKDIPVSVLLDHYAAVVFATGADGSKKLGIPGEDLGGVHSAREFVSYYNTYPFPYGSPRFCPFDLERARRVAVVGNGNVAMDVVRVLGASYKYFCPTDMNCVAVKELMKNQISDISIVARRGVEHSAFAIAEFRELTTYQPETVTVKTDAFDLQKALQAVGNTGRTERAHTRLMELIHKFSITPEEMAAEHRAMASTAEGAPLDTSVAAAAEKGDGGAVPSKQAAGVRPPCTLRFRYDWTPVRFLPHAKRKNYVGGVLLKRSTGGAGAEEQYAVLPCDVVFTSIGYRSDGMPGVPFDHKRGVIPSERGRVVGMPRTYCSGWVRNGAKGVILHSTLDAQETVASILEDIEARAIPTEPSVAAAPAADAAAAAGGAQAGEASEPEVRPFLRGDGAAAAAAVGETAMDGKFGLLDYFVSKKMQPVSVAGVERIFYVEKERGVDLGKRWEKVDSVRDMLDIALGGEVGKKTNERVRGIAPARPDAMLYLKELLDDETDLAPLAHELAKDLPRRLAEEHPPGRIAPSQL